MANTELENNIDLALQKASKSVSYADTILGNTPLDENEGVNINLDVANSAKFDIDGSTFSIDSTVPELPYIELEYIQSTGTQYIDTQFIPNINNLEVDIAFMCTENMVQKSLFGSQQSGSDRFSIIPWTSESNYLGFWVFNSDALLQRNININTKYNLKTYASNNKFFIDMNGVLAMTDITGNVNSTYNMYIFANHQATGATQLSSIKLYSLKIIQNYILIRDFIPVKRLSDNEICLYDKVSETFFINQGTGNFIAGPEI